MAGGPRRSEPPLKAEDDLLTLMICPSCCSLEHKVDDQSPPWLCQTCGYSVPVMPTVYELISGAVTTDPDWDDVDIGAWFRRCIAVVMVYADTITPNTARTLGLALASRHGKLGPAIITEIGTLNRDLAEL